MVQGSNHCGRRTGVVVLLLVVFSALSASTTPAATEGVDTTLHTRGEVVVAEAGCDVMAATIRVPAETVRPLVPAEFTLAIDETLDGQRFAQLWIAPVRCNKMTVNGRTRDDTVYLSLRVSICDPDDEVFGASYACTPNEADGTYVELSHFYQFWFASNNEALVTAFRNQGGVPGDAAVYVEDLVFSLTGAASGPNFSFTAPEPTPSPLTIEARVAPAEVVLGNFTNDYWGAVPTGTMRVSSRLDTPRVGHVEWGTVTPRPHSDLHRILCAPSVDFRSTDDPAGPHDLVLDKYSWLRVYEPYTGFTVGSSPGQLSPVARPGPCPRS